MIRACLYVGTFIGLVFAMLFAATAWGQDEPPPESCDALPKYLSWLRANYGEQPAGMAVFAPGQPPGILVLGPQTWTLLQMRAPGIACAIAAGTFDGRARAL